LLATTFRGLKVVAATGVDGDPFVFLRVRSRRFLHRALAASRLRKRQGEVGAELDLAQVYPELVE